MSFGRRRSLYWGARIDAIERARCQPSPRRCGSTTTSKKPRSSTHPSSRTRRLRVLHRTTEAGPASPASAVGLLRVGWHAFIGINGGPHFQFSEAVSFMVHCKDQAEVDYYWDRLVDGGEESQCGWLKDRFGLSWRDRAGPVVRADQRPGSGARDRRHQGDARDAQDRHRRAGGRGRDA